MLMLSHDGTTEAELAHAAITLASQSLEELRTAQQEDAVTKQICKALSESRSKPRTRVWRAPPLRRYGQLWTQLTLVDGIVCRRYAPGPSSDVVTVPVLPTSLREQALHRNHGIPSAGHQGVDKTYLRLRQEAYWVNMAGDVQQHCYACNPCQRAKLPAPTRAPMTNTPIGRPW